MKHDLTFLKQISLILLITIVIGSYPVLKYFSGDIITGILAGLLLNVINAILGYISIDMGIDKSMSRFLKAVLGGIGIRLLFLIVSMVIVIKVLEIHLYSFIITLFIFYTIFLIFEVLFIDKKVRSKSS